MWFVLAYVGWYGRVCYLWSMVQALGYYVGRYFTQHYILHIYLCDYITSYTLRSGTNRILVFENYRLDMNILYILCMWVLVTTLSWCPQNHSSRKSFQSPSEWVNCRCWPDISGYFVIVSGTSMSYVTLCYTCRAAKCPQVGHFALWGTFCRS